MLFAQSCPTLCDPMDCSPPGSSVDGILQARMSSHFLLQGIFPTQGLNLSFLYWRQILYCLSLTYRLLVFLLIWPLHSELSTDNQNDIFKSTFLISLSWSKPSSFLSYIQGTPSFFIWPSKPYNIPHNRASA